jgi:hypothetical protein
MAPETQRESRSLNWVLADVFSFGALCVDILCPEEEVMLNRQESTLRKAEGRVLPPEEPIRLLAVKCVQDNPKTRPGSFKDIGELLQVGPATFAFFFWMHERVRGGGTGLETTETARRGLVLFFIALKAWCGMVNAAS